jgi:tetratricopeptide (TPR) repeat protein
MSADRRRELAELLANIPETILRKSFYQRILAELAYQTGDLQSALKYFEKRLELMPDDYQSRARWAEIQLAFRNVEAVEAYLRNQRRTEGQLKPQQAMEVSRIYRAVGKPLDALRLIYETLRTYPNSEPVNIALISVLLADRDINLPTDPKIPIGIDTAFAVQHGSQQSIFIVEDRPAEEMREHEMRPEHPLAVRALGQHAGDRVLMSETPYSREEGTILWVKHKYLHALHQTMETFEARFPHQKALFRVPIEKKDGQLELAPILKALDARAEQTQRLTKLYTENHLPLCALAKASRTNVLDLWRGLITDTQINIAVCLGTEDERNKAFKLLKVARTRGLILEPLSLYLLHSLGVLTPVEKLFGRLAVAKATLDTFQDLIDERALQSDGYLSLAKVDGNYVRQEISAEDIAANVRQLQAIVEWAKANCEVVPAVPNQDLQETNPRAAREVLGDAFFDTLLAANGSDRVVLSDDQYLRALANQSFAVDVVWTQPLLLELLAKGELTAEEYVKALGVLIQSKYNFSSVNASDLLTAVKVDPWTRESNFPILASALSARNVQPSSLINVTVEFLTALWKRVPSTMSATDARRLTFALLEHIAPHKSEHVDTFYSGVMKLVPREAGTVIHEWYEGHSVLRPGVR